MVVERELQTRQLVQKHIRYPTENTENEGVKSKSKMDSVRIDKFLWCVRIYKTRTIAKEECDKRRVKINSIEVKPARHVKLGDKISIRKPPRRYTYEIIQLIGKRQGAQLVKNYIIDVTTPEEREANKNSRLAAFAHRKKGDGRPTKKDRRTIGKFMPNKRK